MHKPDLRNNALIAPAPTIDFSSRKLPGLVRLALTPESCMKYPGRK